MGYTDAKWFLSTGESPSNLSLEVLDRDVIQKLFRAVSKDWE